MQQFVVPQFIAVEDKIFGPITVRQFLIMLAGGSAVFVAYRLADLQLFILLFALIGGLTLVFAFAKINGQTFHYFLLNVFQTMRKPSVRIWHKTYADADLKFLMQPVEKEVVEKQQQKASKRTHMRELSLIVNTGGYYGSDDDIYER